MITEEPMLFDDMEDILIEDTPLEGESPFKEETPKQDKKKSDLPPEEEMIDLDEIENLEEEEKKPEEKDKSQHQPSDTSSSPNKNWVLFAKSLEDAGLISSFTDEDFDKLVEETGSPSEAIIAMANQTIEDTIKGYVSNQNQDYQDFIKMRELGVDLNEYSRISKTAGEFNSIKKEDLEDSVEMQRKVVREDMMLKGMDKEEIDDLIESLEDTNKLQKKSEASLSNLHKYKEAQMKRLEEEAKVSAKKQQQQYEEHLEAIRKSVEAANEIVPGIKINKQTKDRLYDMITKPVATTQDGRKVNAITSKMLEDPNKFNLITAELIRLGIYDGKWDSLIKVTKSRAIEELEKVVNSGTQFKTGGSEKGNSQLEALRNIKNF